MVKLIVRPLGLLKDRLACRPTSIRVQLNDLSGTVLKNELLDAFQLKDSVSFRLYAKKEEEVVVSATKESNSDEDEEVAVDDGYSLAYVSEYITIWEAKEVTSDEDSELTARRLKDDILDLYVRGTNMTAKLLVRKAHLLAWNIAGTQFACEQPFY
jgi:hypothetical protein